MLDSSPTVCAGFHGDGKVRSSSLCERATFSSACGLRTRVHRGWRSCAGRYGGERRGKKPFKVGVRSMSKISVGINFVDHLEDAPGPYRADDELIGSHSAAAVAKSHALQRKATERVCLSSADQLLGSRAYFLPDDHRKYQNLVNKGGSGARKRSCITPDGQS